MLSADVLNSSATLNDFDVISTLGFIPGETFTLVVRLKQPQHPDQLRYVAESGATLELYLPKKDGTELTVTMDEFDDDRSMWSGSVSDIDSEELMSGNASFKLTEGSDVSLGYIQNALALVVTGSC